MKIVVDTGVFDQEIKKLNNLRDDFREHRIKYSTEMGYMSESWQGEDYEYFIGQMQLFDEQCRDFEFKIKNMISYLQTYNDNFSTLDENYQNRDLEME